MSDRNYAEYWDDQDGFDHDLEFEEPMVDDVDADPTPNHDPFTLNFIGQGISIVSTDEVVYGRWADNGDDGYDVHDADDAYDDDGGWDFDE